MNGEVFKTGDICYFDSNNPLQFFGKACWESYDQTLRPRIYTSESGEQSPATPLTEIGRVCGTARNLHVTKFTDIPGLMD